ncbi:MAG TPA: LysR family transcriptional regulator [Methyloceanibacter sp.]|nr:LysR family transcriptional regulator [Methyloceanibacter sp.]
MTSRKQGPAARLRIVLGDAIAMGPGKADLLENIRETGSIAAAGRRMGMSYKQAWLLVETMNACFAKPLVEAAKGGKSGGGAALTPLGQQVLARYRRMQKATGRAIAADLAALRRVMRKAPK